MEFRPMGQLVSGALIRMMRQRVFVAVLILVAATAPAWAVDPGVYEYAVLRDGERIGYNRVVAAPSGDGSALELTFELEARRQIRPRDRVSVFPSKTRILAKRPACPCRGHDQRRRNVL